MSVHICTHIELVGLTYKLGRKRQAAIDDAFAKAAAFLREKGLVVERSVSFTDWYDGGKFHAFARVHNYVACPHGELNADTKAAMAEAGRIFCDTLKAWESA